MDATRRLFFVAALLAALTAESAAFVRPAVSSDAPPAPVSTPESAVAAQGHDARPALGTPSATPILVVATTNEGPTGRTARALKRVARARAGGLARAEGPPRALRALHRRAPLAWAPADRVDRTGRPFHGALAPPAPIRDRA